jgi:hypothetical protein
MTIEQLQKWQAWIAVLSAVLFLWIVLKKGSPP